MESRNEGEEAREGGGNLKFSNLKTFVKTHKVTNFKKTFNNWNTNDELGGVCVSNKFCESG